VVQVVRKESPAVDPLSEGLEIGVVVFYGKVEFLRVAPWGGCCVWSGRMVVNCSPANFS